LFRQANEKDFEGKAPPKGCLPARRVFAVKIVELFDKKGESLYSKATFPAFSPPIAPQTKVKSASPGLEVFREIYDEWLLAWKGTPPAAADAPEGNDPKWILWVGMDRAGGDGVEVKWDALKRFHSKRAQVKVKAQGGNQGVISQDYTDPPKGTPPGAFIVYDNHGEAFKDKNADFGGNKPLAEGPRCYHTFSGSGQIELFNALDTPPKDDFGLAFHIYSLLEASLMTVVVVDERLAESMVVGGALATGQLIRLQRSGIFPLFQIRGGGPKRTDVPCPRMSEGHLGWRKSLQIFLSGEGICVARKAWCFSKMANPRLLHLDAS